MAKAKDDGDALRKWRDAEAAYTHAVSPFTSIEGEAPALKKKDLLELVQLRVNADRWREKYFHEGHAKHNE
jgi:hypothetical protein